MSKLIYCATPSRLSFKLSEIMDFVTSKGYGPLHPFQAFPIDRFESGPLGREKSMEYCFRAVSICDEFWIFGISNGTLEELVFAKKTNKKVEFYLDQFDPDWKKYYFLLKDQFNNPLGLLI